MSKFRFGAILGFGAGYYLGAKAGRGRYEQINRLLEHARDVESVETTLGKAKAIVDLSRERARDLTNRGEVVIDLSAASEHA